jgi:uncharacterized iron-regulated membrane protein
MFPDRPRSLLLRHALFQVHLWVGVVAALYLIVISVTGAALVFRINLQRAEHPRLFTPSADGPLVDVVTVLERVREAYPTGRVSGAEAPTTLRPTYLAYVTNGDRLHTVLIDPVSGTILGELPDRSTVRTLQSLHFDLLGGRRGRVINGIGGFCLLVMGLTGLIIWRPGTAALRRGITVGWSRQWKLVTRELHGAVGIWTVAFVVLWAVTGIYFAFPTGFRSAVDWVSPITVSRTPESDASGAGAAPRPTWRSLVARARQRAPDEFVARVVVPATQQSPFLVQFSELRPTPAGGAALRPVYLDQFTGEPLQDLSRPARTLGDTVMAWVAPLHVGNFGGIGVKLVWMITGLAPALLACTGLVLWWTRVVASRRVRSRLS